MYLIAALKLPFSIACTSELINLPTMKNLIKHRCFSNLNFIIDQMISHTSEEKYEKELHVLKNHGETFVKLADGVVT